MTIYAVFRSRTQLFQYLDSLRRLNVSAATAPTPPGIVESCSLSVRFAQADFPKARVALSSYKSGFVGFYKIAKGSSKTFVRII
ncbi:MAG: putative Se/S carrier-like protein [Christensenellaceae bacterium]